MDDDGWGPRHRENRWVGAPSSGKLFAEGAHGPRDLITQPPTQFSESRSPGIPPGILLS
jgi:hypothetical protein